MTSFICATCGTHYQPSDTPPAVCSICADDRQYVGWDGQAWTTHDTIAADHQARIEYDGDLLGIGVTPTFGIPQRALYLPTDAGNILWESTTLITDPAIDELNRRGGVDMIVISHPHFYSGMVAWSEALGGVPILLNDADRQWVNHSSPNVTFWTGDTHRLSPNVRTPFSRRTASWSSRVWPRDGPGWERSSPVRSPIPRSRRTRRCAKTWVVGWRGRVEQAWTTPALPRCSKALFARG